MTDTAPLREAMIVSQLRVSKVSDERVIGAMRAVPREDFLPADKRALAYVDEDVPLGAGRALMEPLVFARLLAAAKVQASDSVLIVGVGSGYSAAVLARLAARVVGVESDPALLAAATQRLGGMDGVTLVAGALDADCPDHAPYDVIVVEGSIEAVPPALVDQLQPEGRLVGVLLDAGVGRGFVGRRSGSGFGINPFMDAQTWPLPGFAKPKAFTF
jgi:protein-L-isoaspartate(D-aspartate) O-methyltransferase